ncbi:MULTISPECIES: hypothetical protein [Mycobacteriaceae]|uniref:hypothetical protein n=1 Tax=Mycobacteriaceae TaxID=1762 RepID=UPI0009D01B92|nr:MULTISPECIES: hypothetical protein [Mycobacteriaceae]MDM2175050.1 hypothetical protein [Mycobacteroides abscessus]SKL51070.1 Uncharacterised protein [Mycobacteroides abscessus subsp. bolletii]MDM2179749.1 hypothetical protein [Mycobacteroides abscessus]MDM2207820.1 hypothetical protein [Mycobacteroides abscessus]MDM2211434.1 hypothetical protein [Mycobacteroides abscessus]
MAPWRKARTAGQRGARIAMPDLREGAGGWWVPVVGTAVVAVFAVAVVGTAMATRGGQHTSPGEATGLDHPAATVAVGADSAPPWPAPADASAAAGAAGLPMARMEGTVLHIHAHLDVQVDGRPVPVPANIGVDGRRGAMSALHTHDASGIIHIESPVRRQFSLGELFTEWQVSLAADHIGGLRAGAGKQLRVIVNGVPQTDNPAAITLAAHDQIAIIYGAPHPGEVIASRYQFADGQ